MAFGYFELIGLHGLVLKIDSTDAEHQGRFNMRGKKEIKGEINMWEKILGGALAAAANEIAKSFVKEANGSIKKLHTFKIVIPSDLTAKRKAMENTVKSQGGKFAGDDSAGCFILGWVQGSYFVGKEHIEVIIHDKAYLDSLTTLEHNIREMFTNS